MSGKIILRIMKIILRIVKIILLRVELETGLCRAQPNFRASECRGQASLVLCRAADKGAFYIDQLVELCVKCQLQ